MRVLVFMTVLAAAHIPVLPQSADKELQIERVQTVVGSLVARNERARVMLRDLSELDGRVTALTEDSFSLRIRGKHNKRLAATIAYRDVLVIESEKASISLIPDPLRRPYGVWDDVSGISYNNYLEVVLENGQSAAGRTGEITKDKLTLFGRTGSEKLVLTRDRIAYVYRVRYPFDNAGDDVRGGVRKGSNIGRGIGLTPVGKALGAGLGAVIGAGVGAVSEAAKKEKKFRVLIFSK